MADERNLGLLAAAARLEASARTHCGPGPSTAGGSATSRQVDDFSSGPRIWRSSSAGTSSRRGPGGNRDLAARHVSITSPIPDGQGIVLTALGHRCFLCFGALDDPAAGWAGSEGEIFLHADCVLDLAVRMFRDVHEIRKPDYYSRRQLGSA